MKNCKLPSEVNKVYVTWPGDLSVGIFPVQIEISAGKDFVIDLGCECSDTIRIVLEEFREKLAEAFEIIGDGKPEVSFDFESQWGDK